jgi:cation diffusion facilitator family transporter
MLVVLVIGIFLGALKFYAYLVTHSNALLGDALESLVNIIASAFALVSIVYAAKPRDDNHPYGHGKIEFFAAGFEGGLIMFAAISMIYKAVISFFHPHEIESLGLGIVIAAAAGLINYLMGHFLIRKGKALFSLTLEADGHHLISDAITSVAIVVGLIVIYFTKMYWLDSLLTILFGVYIVFVGYKLIRKSLAGLMDEADFETIDKIIVAINQSRTAKWIDIHNLRLVKYGDVLHVDAHITLPWYDSLQDAHEEVKRLEGEVNKRFDIRIEFFIHMDPCVANSCSICSLESCNVRQKPFLNQLVWTKKNLLLNKKHD